MLAAMLGVPRHGWASASLELRLSGRVLPVASDLSVLVRLEPAAEDRSLTVMVDSGEYLRSSMAQLDGADDAHAHEFRFTHLPAGSYTVTAILDGVKGRRALASEQMLVGEPSGRRR